MRKPRVLITTYHQAFVNPGGGEIQLKRIAAALKSRGWPVAIYDHHFSGFGDVDVVLHFSVCGGSEYILEAAKQAGKKIVIYPDLYLQPPNDYPVKSIRYFLNMADAVVVASKTGRRELSGAFNLREDLFTVMRTAVPERFAERVPFDFIGSRYGWSDYLLCVGMLEERKGQRQLLRALRGSDYPIVFIGNYRSQAYFEECQAQAWDRCLFLPYLEADGEEIRSAYQRARLFIEPGIIETPGQSAVEAAMSGCRLVLPETGHGPEYFGDRVVYINPFSEKSIREGVETALARPGDPQLSREMMERYSLPAALAPLEYVLMRLAGDLVPA